MQYHADMILGDILDQDPTTAPYFIEIGMHCLGCPASRGETLAQAFPTPAVEKIYAHIFPDAP